MKPYIITAIVILSCLTLVVGCAYRNKDTNTKKLDPVSSTTIVAVDEPEVQWTSTPVFENAVGDSLYYKTLDYLAAYEKIRNELIPVEGATLPVTGHQVYQYPDKPATYILSGYALIEVVKAEDTGVFALVDDSVVLFTEKDGQAIHYTNDTLTTTPEDYNRAEKELVAFFDDNFFGLDNTKFSAIINNKYYSDYTAFVREGEQLYINLTALQASGECLYQLDKENKTVDLYVTAMGIAEQKITLDYSDKQDTEHTDEKDNRYYLPYVTDDNLYVTKDVLVNLLGWEVKCEDGFLGIMCDPTVYQMADSQVIQLDADGKAIADIKEEEIATPEPLPVPTDKDMIAPEEEHDHVEPNIPMDKETEEWLSGWYEGDDSLGNNNEPPTDIDWN